MNSPTLTCDEVEALLPLVADDQLDAVSDPALFSHLADCPHCAEMLAEHDLITFALEPTPAKKTARPTLRWRRWLPVAAAACLAIGLATASSFSSAPHAPSAPPLAQAKTRLAPASPLVPASPLAPASQLAPAPAKISTPIHVDVEVVAVPGSTLSHPRYLVRRGEQVLLVDPTAVPTDAVQASYSVPKQQQVRRY